MSAIDHITKHRHILTFLALAIAILILFGETMGHRFNSDDYLALFHALREPNTSFLESLAEFARPSWGLYYRPGIKLFLEALGGLFGLQPAGYHLMSLICYVVLCFEAYIIGFLLTEKWHIAIAAAIIFLSQSVHGEALFWISSLNGVVENILTLASLICFIVWRQKGTRVLAPLSLLIFIAALLTKESAISLPIILITYSLVLDGDVRPAFATKRALKACWPFVLVGVFFVAARGIVMRQADVPPSLTHFASQTLVVGPWHAFLMTLSPVDWAIPVYFFGRFISMGTFALTLAATGLVALALAPLGLKKYRTAFLLWWIPAGAAPLFALGLVPSERHVIISSVAASVLIALALFKSADWLTRGPKRSSIAIGCVLVLAFSMSGLYSLKQRQGAWAQASEVAHNIVEQTMNICPIPERNTTFFFLNVPDSIDEAFVFRFDNLAYALKLFYGDDSIDVIRIVAMDRVPDASLASREIAYFRIGAMGGHLFLSDGHLQNQQMRNRWGKLEHLEILSNDFRFIRDWERYSASPFLIYMGGTLAPGSPDELKRVLDGLYSLL